MSVWYAIPTANAPLASKCFAAWKRMGYQTAALTDGDTPRPENCDLHVHVEKYTGWPCSVNYLINALRGDYDPDWIVTGADDVYPDFDLTADEIAARCTARFGGTLGVMQPIGDRWGNILNAAVSPWLGRDWICRAYEGHGPLFSGYQHFFADGELQAVATEMGVFWQRPDLSQFHDHFTRGKREPTEYQKRVRRPGGAWDHDHALFAARQSAGFPGHELA